VPEPDDTGANAAGSAQMRAVVGQTTVAIKRGDDTTPPHMMVVMAEQPTVSPFSRPPVSPKVCSRPAPTARTVLARKPAGPVAAAENLPLGFMAGLLAAGVGAGLWALITIVVGFQIGWMAVGVGFLVGWAVRMAGKGRHSAFGIMGAFLALGGCAVGNLLAIIMIAARQYNLPPLAVFGRLTPDVVLSLMAASFRPMHVIFYFVAILEGYRFSIVRGG
jgi:hypothetical protein